VPGFPGLRNTARAQARRGVTLARPLAQRGDDLPSTPRARVAVVTGASPTLDDLGYPRFGLSEMQRRTTALNAAMETAEVGHAILLGANRNGSAVGWLTRWPVTREAAVVHTPGKQPLLLVNFYNHVPNATRIATEAEVRWAGEDAFATAVRELRRRGVSGADRIGVIGPLSHRAHSALSSVGKPVDLNAAYTRLRLIKSAEEIEWLGIGARMTDDAVRAVARAASPGTSEHELADAAQRGYVAAGGSTHIHYFGATPMSRPGLAVPAQYPSARRLAAGDALSCEISASFWDYTGQLLRTFAVAEAPSALYRELHDVADAAFDAIVGRLRAGASAAELVEASGLIEDAGFTIRDDLVHGFVGGYFPPVLGTRSRMLSPVPDFTFEAGMTVVVQPNVVTPDERAGVQTGELLLVGEDGAQRLHAFPRGMLRAPDLTL
jgi:Xaa-Pro dipeptidase